MQEEAPMTRVARTGGRTLRATLLAGLLGVCVGLAPAAISAATSATPAAVDQALRDAIAGPQRSSDHKKRDDERHPRQTLEFFGIRPDMRVEEFLPEGGWYTEILAPFLHDHGKLVEAAFPTTSSNSFLRGMARRYRHKLAADSSVYGRVSIRPISPPDYMPLGPPASQDMILTFRNLHDLVYANAHHEAWGGGLRRFFRSAYRALVPGGVVGVVAHRANPGANVGKSAVKGRLPQAYVVAQARHAGFRLAASSDINANPRDDRTKPVWYFTPSLKAPKDQRAKYRAMGAADNMTLRFVKPADSADAAG